METETKEQLARMAKRMTSMYVWRRHHNCFNAWDFGLYWNNCDDTFLKRDIDEDFTKVVIELFDELAKDPDYKVKKPGRTVLPKSINRKGWYSAYCLANSDEFVLRLLVELEEDELRDELEGIITDRRFANESAQMFIEEFDNPKIRRHEKYNINDFLQFYDMKESNFLRRKNGPVVKSIEEKEDCTYTWLRERLIAINGEGGWFDSYLMLLEPEYKQRVIEIMDEISDNGITDDTCINFLNKLADCESIGLIEAFEDGESYDYLVAMFGEKKFPPRDRRIISQIKRGSVKGVSWYLGKGKVRRRGSDTEYDWKHQLVDRVINIISPQKLNAEKIIYRRLFNQLKEKYMQDFKTNPNTTIEMIELEKESEENEARQYLLAEVEKHYRLMNTPINAAKKTLSVPYRK